MKVIVAMLAVFIGFFHSLVGSLIQDASGPINNAVNAIVATVDKQLPSQSSDALANALAQVSNQISTKGSILKVRLIQPNVRRLPRNIGTNVKASTGEVAVLAGDNGVSQAVVTAANQIVSSISLPTLQGNIGHIPNQSVNIVLFSTPTSYANALLRAGVAASSINSIVNNSGGITVNSDIWIPLYSLQDKADLADVLTHELTHVTFNQMGIGSQLPTWLNEGTAWYDGLAGQAKVNSAETQAESAALRQSVLQAVQTGQALPLTASETQILNSPYNVEFEDYMAVQNLIDQHGAAAFKSFISHSVSKGVAGSFAAQFGTTLNAYAQAYYRALGQAAQANYTQQTSQTFSQQPAQTPQPSGQQSVQVPQSGGKRIVIIPVSPNSSSRITRRWARVWQRVYGGM